MHRKEAKPQPPYRRLGIRDYPLTPLGLPTSHFIFRIVFAVGSQPDNLAKEGQVHNRTCKGNFN